MISMTGMSGPGKFLLGPFKTICFDEYFSGSVSKERGQDAAGFFLSYGLFLLILHSNNTPHASQRCAPWGVTFFRGR